MYRHDSFFDLTPWGQVGLACLTVVLSLTVLLIARLSLRNRTVGLRILGSLSLFWLFVWLSPQIYYLYYRLIIEDLPLQWVIWPPPSVIEPLELLFFQGPHSLSAHGRGLLGWSLIVAPFVNHRIAFRHDDAR